MASSAFALLHGPGNGIITIARGMVPLVLFGRENYGYRLGLLGMPSRFLSALAPFGFALLLEHIGARILVVSAGPQPRRPRGLVSATTTSAGGRTQAN